MTDLQLKIGEWDGNQRYLYAHAKYDGYQLRIARDNMGHLTAISRRGVDYLDSIKCSPRIRHGLTHLQPNHEVWGELWYPGKPASYISTALRLQDEQLRFSAFCTPCLPPEAPLHLVAEYVDQMGFDFIPFYVQPGVRLQWAEDRFTDPSYLAVSGDIEGYVLKNGNMWEMVRYKPKRTIDLIICDYKDGKGKYEFFVGSLVCKTTEGHVVANVSGMDDDMREEISCREDFYLGKVIEVEYQYVGAKGKLRHPQFKRFRDDKTPAECSCWQSHDLGVYYEGLDAKPA